MLILSMKEPLLVYETFALLRGNLSFMPSKTSSPTRKRLSSKGLQALNIHALRKTIGDLKQSLPRTWVWSSSLETAINEATPNKANKRKTQSHRPQSLQKRTFWSRNRPRRYRSLLQNYCHSDSGSDAHCNFWRVLLAICSSSFMGCPNCPQPNQKNITSLPNTTAYTTTRTD